MKENNSEQKKRRFRSSVYGPVIKQLYSTMPTYELARRLGITVREIENYVYRHNHEPWDRKSAALISKMNSAKGKKGGRPRKKSK